MSCLTAVVFLDDPVTPILRHRCPFHGPHDRIGREETRGRGTAMETSTQTALVLAAQAGDQTAFDTLVEPYRRELLVHCYRMLGSLHNAEDLVQETLLRAWEKRATLTSPGSYRAWLYRIATNLCLNTLTRVPRRSLPADTHPQSDPTRPNTSHLRTSPRKLRGERIKQVDKIEKLILRIKGLRWR